MCFSCFIPPLPYRRVGGFHFIRGAAITDEITVDVEDLVSRRGSGLWGEYSPVLKRGTLVKSEGLFVPQDTQKDPTFHPSASTPPNWSGFYQRPIENDIMDGTDWIDSLWKILHREDPSSSYCTSRCLTPRLGMYLERSLSCLKHDEVAHTQTKTLYTIHDILECRGYLKSVCPGLINDILQEIKDNNSDTIAGPELEDKMSMLQVVVTRQHRLRDPDESGCARWVFTWLVSAWFATSVTSTAHLRSHDIVSEFDDLNINAFQLIWAVRDMVGLLTLIAESEDSSFPGVLYAERFLKASRVSVVAQERRGWTDQNFRAHHWNDHDNNLLRTRYTACQALPARRIFSRISPFSSMAATRIYTKVFRVISRSDSRKFQTDSSRQNGYRRLATVKPEASTTAPVPASIASGDDLSMTNSSYARTDAQDTKDSA
ncbi:hypothetical protein F5146DRAFT_1001807 [Armillaria mellea]|nr:hypothetical protein F5146DRAFT_1001807 [Armillaria mellea]